MSEKLITLYTLGLVSRGSFSINVEDVVVKHVRQMERLYAISWGIRLFNNLIKLLKNFIVKSGAIVFTLQLLSIYIHIFSQLLMYAITFVMQKNEINKILIYLNQRNECSSKSAHKKQVVSNLILQQLFIAYAQRQYCVRNVAYANLLLLLFNSETFNFLTECSRNTSYKG